MAARDRESELRERLMERLGEALDAIDSGSDPEGALDTLPALSEALSALCLEDIANTIRVVAYGPEPHLQVVDEPNPTEH